MEKVSLIVGDRTDDDALSFIEDCKDTFSSDGDDWKAKYEAEVQAKEELDKTWRQKYKDAFFAEDDSSHDNHENNSKTTPAKPKDTIDDDEQAKLEQANKVRFDDLFKPAD